MIPAIDRQTKGKMMLCNVAARNFKKTIMRGIKETEEEIAGACAIFHKKYEQKTGKPITTISEFERVTREFSKLSKSELEILIKEGKEEEKTRKTLIRGYHHGKPSIFRITK